MKLSIAVSFVLAALASANPFAPATSANSPKAEYIANLLRGARRLANDNANNAGGDAADLTGYNVVFSKCQFVKTFSDNLANSDSETVLTTERFVVFKLCPSCSSCSSSLGEYIIDLQTYLKYTVYYAELAQQGVCASCANSCTDTDDKGAAGDNVGEDDKVEGNGRRTSSTTSSACSCVQDCNFYENLGSNGYYDAGDLVECVQIYQSEDGSETLYGGPVCGNYGSKIKIGVFTDNECRNYDSSKDVENYLKNKDDGSSMKLSYNILQQAYTTCINCTYVNNGAEETRPVCSNLYAGSAKCESSSSSSGSSSSSDSVVCNYINSVTSGTYAESGDITLSGVSASMRSGAKTSGGQKFALTFFVLGTVGLAAYAAMLHSKLTKGGKADLTSQSGAMA